MIYCGDTKYKLYKGNNRLKQGQEEYPGYELYFHLCGEDAPVSNVWTDRIAGTKWVLTGVTYNSEDGYYQFAGRKPSAGYASVYARSTNANHSGFALGKEWIIDYELAINSNIESGGCLVDFGSVQGTASGTHTFNINISRNTSTHRCHCTGQLKPASNTVARYTSIIKADEWPAIVPDTDWVNVRGQTTCEVISSTKSRMSRYLNGILCGYTDFSTITFNNFSTYDFYIGRGLTNNSSYKNQLAYFRLKNLKIYNKIE